MSVCGVHTEKCPGLESRRTGKVFPFKKETFFQGKPGKYPKKEIGTKRQYRKKHKLSKQIKCSLPRYFIFFSWLLVCVSVRVSFCACVCVCMCSFAWPACALSPHLVAWGKGGKTGEGEGGERRMKRRANERVLPLLRKGKKREKLREKVGLLPRPSI